jgi:ubiquitin-protein ligase E3 B
MAPAERQAVLRFVTSCSRPPLLGFKHLHPPFTIRIVPAEGDEDASFVDSLRSFFGRGPVSKAQLPTAATCFNMLKLPDYPSAKVLAEKLRMAVTSNAGFNLS